VAGTGNIAPLTVGELLELVAAEEHAPAAGTAAALAAATAAALVSMAARRSVASWPDAPGIAAQALVRRARLLARAESGAEAFEAAVRALESGAALEPPLRRTVEELLPLADGAADVAELAATAAELGEGHVRPDAVSAAVLAEAAVRAVAILVRANLTVPNGDERLARVERVEAAAREAARRALEA